MALWRRGLAVPWRTVFLVHQNLVLQRVSSISDVCALLLWLSCSFLQSNCLKWVSLLLWVGLGPCGVSGPVWGCLGLNWVRPGVCRNAVTPNYRGLFPLFSFEKLLLVGGACSQMSCLPPALCGASWLVCVVISPSASRVPLLTQIGRASCRERVCLYV